MGCLDNITIFLSGPIDRTDDDGIIWRNDIKNRIYTEKINVDFFDPCNKPKGLGSETRIEKTLVTKLVNANKWDEAKQLVKKFRRYDLRGVDTSNLIIAYVDIDIHSCGTYDEVFTAERQGKPVFIIMARGYTKKDIPRWLLAFINHNEIFESVSDCVSHLKKIDNGEISMDRRWVLIPK